MTTARGVVLAGGRRTTIRMRLPRLLTASTDPLSSFCFESLPLFDLAWTTTLILPRPILPARFRHFRASFAKD